MYCIYHIPGKKIGVTNDVTNRLINEQGYSEDEFEILEMSESFNYISTREVELQEEFGYRMEPLLYKDQQANKNNNIIQLKKMDINVTDQTTTFPCPVNKLKGRLMDEIGMTWETNDGTCAIDTRTIKYIMKHVQPSQYTKERCYVYNKALVREVNAMTTGSLLTNSRKIVDKDYREKRPAERFELIRAWAKERGLYDKGDTKTQYLKLMEEAGELGRAILAKDQVEFIDAIGDMVVVLTNLAELGGTSIEHCTDIAYEVISKRTGKMVNGTFVKDER
jgi:NTP pyrophosphatase (non-canonical NTP hydrolase)